MTLADISNPAISTTLGTPTTNPGSSASKLLGSLINFGLVAGSVAFVFMFLIGGFQWITSGGDKDAVQKARNRIMHGLTGLIVMLALYAILDLLGDTLGFNLLRFTIPDTIN